MVGEIKKGKYVYYHCSGARGKCGQPYVRQETLEEAYAAMLKRISINEEIVNWIATALRESHGDQKRFRDESVAKLQQEHTRLQNRLDVIYEDRLDGRIDLSLFERKSGEYRQDQARIQAEINGFGTADAANPIVTECAQGFVSGFVPTCWQHLHVNSGNLKRVRDLAFHRNRICWSQVRFKVNKGLDRSEGQ